MFDADEILVFPGAEADGALPALCADLDTLGAEALRVVMLDLFPRLPLAEAGYRPDQPLIEAAGWFEPPRLRQEAVPDFPYVAEYGGVRERLFFPRGGSLPAAPSGAAEALQPRLAAALPARCALVPRPGAQALPQHDQGAAGPLAGRVGFVSNHTVSPVKAAAEQPSGVLLHFKFLQDFHARVMDAVARDAHFDGSAEYRRYLAALKRDPRFSLHGPRARAYEGPAQLVALGLMRDTPAWRQARGG